MSFWSSEVLAQRLPKENLVDPYVAKRIKHAAYELSLGGQAYVTSTPKKVNLPDGDHITIPPGQFALLHSAETVTVPSNAIALISIKAKIKLNGLINISGFHVDPGFTGQLVFSVHNAGSRPVTLACGDPTFLTWYNDLTAATADVYNGTHGGQKGISSEAVNAINGDIATPSSLAARLSKLEATSKSHGRTIGMCFVAFLIGLALLVFGKF